MLARAETWNNKQVKSGQIAVPPHASLTTPACVQAPPHLLSAGSVECALQLSAKMPTDCSTPALNRCRPGGGCGVEAGGGQVCATLAGLHPAVIQKCKSKPKASAQQHADPRTVRGSPRANSSQCSGRGAHLLRHGRPVRVQSPQG